MEGTGWSIKGNTKGYKGGGRTDINGGYGTNKGVDSHTGIVELHGRWVGIYFVAPIDFRCL